MEAVTLLTSNGMKILLLDDDAFLRDMYATKFKESGYDVTVVENGEQALTELRKGGYEVMLLDMVMPGMTGLELLAKITEMKLDANLTRIVLSNQGGKEEVDAAYAAGAKGYIIKAELIPSEVVAEVTKLVS